MNYRRLTPTGDYTFGQNKLDYLADKEAVAQAIQTRLKLLLGEWWEDQADGLPLFEQILLQRNTPGGRQTIDLLIRERIMDTPHVLEILSFTSWTEGRQYKAEISVDTDFGRLTETLIQEVG